MKRFFTLLAFLLLVSGFVNAQKYKPAKSFNKAEYKDKYTLFNINNISTWIKNDGEADYNPQTGASGFEYPKGENKQAIFQSGVIWAGYKLNDSGDSTLHCGGSTFQQGCLPGKIFDDGSVEDPASESARAFRVRRDIHPGSNINFVDLSDDVDRLGGTEETYFEKYIKDWNEWPADRGAPFEDINNNGTYEPAIDTPGIDGADQTIWFVMNDFDSDKSRSLYGSDPMNVEVQVTAWGFKRVTGALDNTMFKKYLLINKSGKKFVDMYFGIWSDPDMGNAVDDFVGCDTALSLGYCYNGITSDRQYGLNVPSVGFALLTGPAVDSSPNDTAYFNNRFVQGKKNLEMNAFGFLVGHDVYTDPPLGNYKGTKEWYNYVRGLIGITGDPYLNPLTGEETKFLLTGDPITKSGWVDGYLYPPGNRRMYSSTGPFNMEPADTQQVIFAEIAAGYFNNMNRLSSLSLLKLYTKSLQMYESNGYKAYDEIPSPEFRLSGFDQKIVIDWGCNHSLVKQIENFDKLGYKFEGYNIYQLKNKNMPLDSARKIAVYDIKNNVTGVVDQFVDPATGSVVLRGVQEGTDSGIKRTLLLTGDMFNKDFPFHNGSEYYFAVTAYAHNASETAYPKTLESALNFKTVVPQKNPPGVVYNAEINEKDTLEHTAGTSDGNVFAQIIDPSGVTGDLYEITFSGSIGETTYNVLNKTKNTTIITGLNNSVESYPVDGIIFTTENIENNFKSFQMTANAHGAISPPVGAAADWSDWGHGPTDGSNRPTYAQQTNDGRWLVQTSQNTIEFYSDFFDKVTQYSGGFGEPNRGIYAVIPDDIEFRFTSSGDEGFFHFTTKEMRNIPFEVWNTQGNDDPSDDFKLLAIINDNDGDGTFDLSSVGEFGAGAAAEDADHVISSDTNDPFTDGIYLVQPLDETPGTKGYDELTALIEADPDAAFDETLWTYKSSTYNTVPSLIRLCFVNWNGGDVSKDGTNYNSQMPEIGSIIKISTTKPFSSEDKFSYQAPAIDTSLALAKADVDEINVFPNPYYGTHANELSRSDKYVTFSHLPEKATIRIFNLAGHLIKVIEKDTPSQFERWNLQTDQNRYAASGLYIAYIDMPELGKTKTLKFAVIQEK